MSAGAGRAGRVAAARGRPRRSRGFTLLEVMLAFALLATGLGLLVAIQASGLRQVHTSASVSEASLHAQSLLDRLGVLERIEPGTEEGEFDGGRYRWELLIEQTEDPVAAGELPAGALPVDPAVIEAAAPTLLYRVVLDVRWGEGETAQALRFVTLRARQPLMGTAP